MSYSLSVSADGNYIIIKVWGNMTRQIGVEIAIAASQLGQEKNINRFLQDLTESKNMETLANNYYLAHQDLQQTEVNQTAIVACLVNPADHSHDFVETASRNAGYKVKLFTDKQKAIAYLLQE